ncbi:SWIM zinc finger family protein [Paenibacillus maysiensis]|uniref:SWIM zinc finger family protein n=1 Tax=Paenibacillus maysiensis TaxID=1155954 RepID=UPI00046FDAF9|nr:SWIM zinc finger family protein [Paenibacillus maysiensis]
MTLEMTESYVDALAPNAAAIKNAQGLIKKKKFVHLHQSSDGTLLFAECSGSGSTNYICSADFIQQEKPVFRCNCPSRQFPCKHALGMLYAYVAGNTFDIAEIPEDIVAKREKIEKREEKQAQAIAAAPEESEAKKKRKPTASKNALKKKVQSQLDGLDTLEKLTLSLIRDGLATVDSKMVKSIQDHVKQMGNYYLSGAQNELRRLSLLLSDAAQREHHYTYIIGQFTRIHALIKKGRQHLQAKLDDPELALDHESTIEEWLGHAWQLSELKEVNRVTEQAELIQLSFVSYDDAARQEYVDLGYWFELSTGLVRRTLQYRPYKAAKLMREEDSFFDVACVDTLYIYPGDLNPRVRWDGMTSRQSTAEDVQAVAKQGAHSYSEVLKIVKNQLKNPLADPHPAVLIYANEIQQAEDGTWVVADEQGQQLILADISVNLPGTVDLLPYVPEAQLTDMTLFGVFEHQMDTGRLVFQPLTIIKDQQITRLLY